MKQEVRVSVNLMGGSMIEKSVISGVNTNAKKGREAMESVISKIDSEVRDLAQGICVATTVSPSLSI